MGEEADGGGLKKLKSFKRMTINMTARGNMDAKQKFEKELKQFLNEKRFKKVKIETEEYKYPPILHIENRLNPNVLDDEADKQPEIIDVGSHSLTSRQPIRNINPTQPVDICRVSPMLRSVISNDTFHTGR
jgi:hypothetical protein